MLANRSLLATMHVVRQPPIPRSRPQLAHRDGQRSANTCCMHTEIAQATQQQRNGCSTWHEQGDLYTTEIARNPNQLGKPHAWQAARHGPQHNLEPRHSAPKRQPPQPTGMPRHLRLEQEVASCRPHPTTSRYYTRAKVAAQ